MSKIAKLAFISLIVGVCFVEPVDCFCDCIEAPIFVKRQFELFWDAKLTVDFPDDVSFKAANDLTFAFTVFRPLFDIG